MQKKIVIFEGLGSAGKSTLIQKLKNDLESEYKIEVLDNKYPKYAAILFSNHEELSLPRGKYAYFCFRWTRLFLFFNYIVNSDSNFFFFDRGILTSYIYGKEDGIPDFMLNDLINDLLALIKENNIVYKTVLVDCDIEIANSRLSSRIGVDVDKKVARNFMFEPYLENISKYFFVNDLTVINSSNSSFEDYDALISYLRN